MEAMDLSIGEVRAQHAAPLWAASSGWMKPRVNKSITGGRNRHPSNEVN